MTIAPASFLTAVLTLLSPWVWGTGEGLFRPFLSQHLVLGDRFKPEIIEGFRLLVDPDLGWDPWATEDKYGCIPHRQTVSMDIQ